LISPGGQETFESMNDCSYEIGNSPTSRRLIRWWIAICLSILACTAAAIGRLIRYSSRSRLRRSRVMVRGLTDRASVTTSSRHAAGGMFTRPLISTFPVVTIGGQMVRHSLTRILHGYQTRERRVPISSIGHALTSDGRAPSTASSPVGHSTLRQIL
jgi:hypothetical protein